MIAIAQGTLKVLFGIFLAALSAVLVFGRVNGDRGFAMAILIVACICQMLFGPVSNQRRKNNEVLVFHPQRRKQ